MSIKIKNQIFLYTSLCRVAFSYGVIAKSIPVCSLNIIYNNSITVLIENCKCFFFTLVCLCGFQYMEEFADLLLPVTDHRHVVVERVVQHLAQRNKDISEVSDVAWSVHVVQSPNTNAFVLPVSV